MDSYITIIFIHCLAVLGYIFGWITTDTMYIMFAIGLAACSICFAIYNSKIKPTDKKDNDDKKE